MRQILLFYFLLFFISNLNAQQKPLFDVSYQNSANADSTLAEIQKVIIENYYYNGITRSDLSWAAIEGILRHISPPESPDLATLWTDKEYERILNSLKGIKVTMGFNSSFNSNDGSLTVTSIINDSQAEQELEVNDRILRIDNEALKGKSIDDINKLLDGELGKSSTLKVVRDIAVFDVTLIRDSLKVDNLIVTRIPSNQAALIELKKITLGLAEELKVELKQLEKSGVKNIILDLRNNTGGVLNEGVNIARLFMKKNDIVLRTQSRSNSITNYVADIDQFHTHNVIVLINENTASAAEIICAALQDHKRALLVGKKTYGKGVIETTFTLKNEYRLKFITSAMYSPKGVSWQSKGLLPDYFIDQSQSNYNEVINLNINDRIRSDLHLSTALKILTE